MTLDEAKAILQDEIQPDGGLAGGDFFNDWEPCPSSNVICLDGHFAVEKLEAIVTYVRHIEEEIRNGQ